MSLKRNIIKSFIIASTISISLVAPLTLPIFAVVCIATQSTSLLSVPFMILELKTIITFIIES